ncbi:glycoside hydrolase family 16 protein [Nocardioides immobilis]|uniref:Glycoside hydrolase family 16 protein n=1 Tax=Nocardioides immobilis TaxID=2049295 RepID=A0A417Y2W3_9ACTN|nr:glycoside hydrolase family 16 protein [Nocardioides immobilis]RHW26897.1 glycoside hydrolase family 16 protein [Nocardioides immobilis]
MPVHTPRGRRLLATGLALAVLALTSADAARSALDPPAPATVRDACGPVLAKPGVGTWQCTFVDEFHGSSLDTEKWITQDTARTGFKTGLTCYRGADNVAVSSGALLLEARDEGVPLNCDNPYGVLRTRYTGGLVSTRGHFSQVYGRFEVRAKWPSATEPGLHGTFWMFPSNPTYGRWPASGEIDIAEWWSNDPTLVLPSLHYNGRSFHADSGWSCRVDDPSTFHTYAVEWYPTGMRFFIDGSMCFSRLWAPDHPHVPPQPFDHPFSMILNMGVGTSSGTNPVSPTTPLPATLTVDHAKAWR